MIQNYFQCDGCCTRIEESDRLAFTYIFIADRLPDVQRQPQVGLKINDDANIQMHFCGQCTASMNNAILRQVCKSRGSVMAFDLLLKLGVIDTAGTVQRHRFFGIWDFRNDVILDTCVYCQQPQHNREHQYP